MDKAALFGAIWIAVTFVLFLAFRAGVLWYFRIPDAIDHLRGIEEYLASIDDSLKQMPAAQAWRARMRAQGKRSA